MHDALKVRRGPHDLGRLSPPVFIAKLWVEGKRAGDSGPLPASVIAHTVIAYPIGYVEKPQILL